MTVPLLVPSVRLGPEERSLPVLPVRTSLGLSFGMRLHPRRLLVLLAFWRPVQAVTRPIWGLSCGSPVSTVVALYRLLGGGGGLQLLGCGISTCRRGLFLLVVVYLHAPRFFLRLGRTDCPASVICRLCLSFSASRVLMVGAWTCG